jgi:hypothetical protein
MAFILIQHLDPTHVSMMVDLLAGHTPMTVQQAADGMPLERDHVYLIPPGTYLSIRGGALRLSEPLERHGARLPFDFFLRSLAEELGERAICVILSGTGSDGSQGLKAVKENGGCRGPCAPGSENSRNHREVRSAAGPQRGAERPGAERSSPGSLGRHYQSSAHKDLARFRAIQAGHIVAPDRAAHGAGHDR